MSLYALKKRANFVKFYTFATKHMQGRCIQWIMNSIRQLRFRLELISKCFSVTWFKQLYMYYSKMQHIPTLLAINWCSMQIFSMCYILVLETVHFIEVFFFICRALEIQRWSISFDIYISTFIRKLRHCPRIARVAGQISLKITLQISLPNFWIFRL